jgi:TPR repeat protein
MFNRTTTLFGVVTMKIRVFLLAFAMFFASAAAMAGGTLDDGITAMLRGDNATALKVFRPLAVKGNAEAQYYMGYMYQSGIGVPVDKKTALQWYNRSAAQGNNGASIQAQVIARSMPAQR